MPSLLSSVPIGFALSIILAPAALAQCTFLTPAQMFLDPNTVAESSSYPTTSFTVAPATLNVPNGGDPVVGLKIAPPAMLSAVNAYIANVDYNACIDAGAGTGLVNFLSSGSYTLRVDRMSGATAIQIVSVDVKSLTACFKDGEIKEFPCPTPAKAFEGDDVDDPPDFANQCTVTSIADLVTDVCAAAGTGTIPLVLVDHGCEGSITINGAERISCAPADAANLTAFCALAGKISSITLLSCSTGHGAAGKAFLEKLSTKFGGIPVTGYTGNVESWDRNGTRVWGSYGEAITAKVKKVPEQEPNNSPSQAQSVAPGVQIDGGLLAGDLDWFRFTSSGGELRFTTNGTTDTRLQIVAADGITVLAGNDDSRGLQSDITINLAAGVYYVLVTGFSATTAGPYSLDLGLECPTKAFTATEVEPNDLVSDPGVFAVTGNAQVSGELNTATDIDLYRVVLSAPRTGLWFQVTEGDTPWTSQHRIEFYDSLGALLTPTATLGTNAIDSGTFSFRSSNVRCWPAGTYYVGVRNRTVALTWNPVPLGKYRLEILHMPMNIGVVMQEPDPPGINTNNDFMTATPIQPGDQGRGHITISTGPDPRDYWGPINIPVPSTLMFQTGQLVGGPTGIPLQDSTINLRLLDVCSAFPTPVIGPATAVTAGNILDPTSHARGTFSFFLAPSTYYLEVVSPGTAASQQGDYVLEISAIVAAPYVAASYTTFAANGSCGVPPFPTLTRAFTNEVPTIGQVFVRAITGLDPFGIGVFIQDINQICPPNVIPAPLAVSGSCFLNVAPAVLEIGIADAAGVLESTLFVPCSVSLRGAVLWEQAAELFFPSFTVHYGNYARAIVGDRSY